MAELDFSCTSVEADRFAASPTVTFRMRATGPEGVRVHAAAIRCQVRIEPVRRAYDEAEATALGGLFGERERWGSTLQPLQLAFLSQVLPGFTGESGFDLSLPCSYDFDVAAHRYLDALADGDVPLLLLFSGTVFTGTAGAFRVSPVPWHKETRVRLPVRVWREAMDVHFPGQAWLRLDRHTFDRLSDYGTRHQLAGWEDTVERLLKEAGE
ncbi:MAG: DUF6084 family protein [Nocardioides sp.]